MSSVCLFHPDGGGVACAICKAIAIERETVAAIAAGLRAKATESVWLLEQCDVNDANKTVHAAQSLAFYDAAEWLESGAWKHPGEGGQKP